MERVRQAGKRLQTGHLEVRIAVSLLSYCRVAVVVAKYGHTVVKRNQLRRRLRELARVLLIPKLSGLDLVIRALPNAYAADFKELAEDIEQIQLKLIVNSSSVDA